jgi:hypothetical protein
LCDPARPSYAFSCLSAHFLSNFLHPSANRSRTAEVDPLRTDPCSIIGRRSVMLYTIAVILLIAWLLGIVGTYTIGAFVHLLLVVAIVMILVGFITGRRPVV